MYLGTRPLQMVKNAEKKGEVRSFAGVSPTLSSHLSVDVVDAAAIADPTSEDHLTEHDDLAGAPGFPKAKIKSARQASDDDSELRGTLGPTGTGSLDLDATAAAAPNRIAAPRKQKLSSRDSTVPPLPGQVPVSNSIHNDDMNDAVMGLFLEETRKGTFRVMGGRTLAEGFERMSAAMSRQFPFFAWSSDKLRSKYATEKKKFKGWLFWRDEVSGASFDERGCAVGTEEQKRQYFAKNPDQDWILSQALRNRDRYLGVFFRKRVDGQYCVDATGWHGTDLSVAEDSPTLLPPIDESSTPALQKAADANLVAASIAQALGTAFSQIASGITVTEGKSFNQKSCEEAVADVIATFESRLSTEQLAACVDRLSDHKEATLWNILPIGIKEEMVRRWLADAGLPAFETLEA
ncbi:hypothetical protein SEPCBS57363_006367 [Sporothrix epigloea]|uniref:Myb/SANT-like domain-containing protein n=1 Tax=Sporothrix epigloea TaxID=1892477 RepID=A0ABP0E2N7_9PEZI